MRFCDCFLGACAVGYQQKYLPFPSVARNKRHAQRVPSDVGNGQSKFGGDTMRRSGDIRVRAEASAIGRKWRRRGTSQEDDHSLTFDPNEFGVREPNSAEIGLAVFEKRSNRRTHRQTDRQTPLLYIYRYMYTQISNFSSSRPRFMIGPTLKNRFRVRLQMSLGTIRAK